MRSQIITVVQAYTSVSFLMVPCAVVADGYQHFGGICGRR